MSTLPITLPEPTDQPSTRTGQAFRLEHAIAEMAGRYGRSLLLQGLYASSDTVKWERAHRASDRQYRALIRLASALSDLAMDSTR